MNWQTIETAPKDGTHILLRHKKGRIADGCWLAANSSSGCWVWAYVKIEPTHWMPLPAAPGAAEERGKFKLIDMQNHQLRRALVSAKCAINSMKAEAETAAQGDEQMMLEACEQISNEGLQASMEIDAALRTEESP